MRVASKMHKTEEREAEKNSEAQNAVYWGTY